MRGEKRKFVSHECALFDKFKAFCYCLKPQTKCWNGFCMKPLGLNQWGLALRNSLRMLWDHNEGAWFWSRWQWMYQCLHKLLFSVCHSQVQKSLIYCNSRNTLLLLEGAALTPTSLLFSWEMKAPSLQLGGKDTFSSRNTARLSN